MGKGELVMSEDSKIILITGAKGGLGNSVTPEFLEAGATVVGSAETITKADFPNSRFTAIPADLSRSGNAADLIAAVLKRFGRIDGLVHLIGGFAGGKSVAETDDSTLDRMLDVNLRCAFYVIRAVLPAMRERGAGRIVAVGSKAAVEPAPMAGAYAASKAALVSLVRTVARENADRAIAANVILPGTMDTPTNRAAMPGADFSQWVPPSQVAKLLAHLVLGESSQISGAVIPVYGSEA
jgi:NAD(P)-dependent dehydrogenase (short-subunit alcohol dehydrogenase family)